MAKKIKGVLKLKAWAAYVRYIKFKNTAQISPEAFEEFGSTEKPNVNYEEIRTKYIALYDELKEERGE